MDQKPSKETLDKWHKDPNNWTLGLFYYNKEDKRIFPPKEWLGLDGLSISNPISVAVLAIVLIIIIGISFFAQKKLSYTITTIHYSTVNFNCCRSPL
jgi:uncharacterized membrane protein